MRKWDTSKCEKFQFVIQNLVTESTGGERQRRRYTHEEREWHFRFIQIALKIYNQIASINHCLASHCKVKLSSSFRWFNYSYWMRTRPQSIWKETQVANTAKCHRILNRMSHLSEIGETECGGERMLRSQNAWDARQCQCKPRSGCQGEPTKNAILKLCMVLKTSQY